MILGQGLVGCPASLHHGRKLCRLSTVFTTDDLFLGLIPISHHHVVLVAASQLGSQWESSLLCSQICLCMCSYHRNIIALCAL
jgi:hypothetical protein